MYELGDGVPKDKAEAARWYRLAAEQGGATAHNRLGVMYELGRTECPKDEGRGPCVVTGWPLNKGTQRHSLISVSATIWAKAYPHINLVEALCLVHIGRGAGQRGSKKSKKKKVYRKFDVHPDYRGREIIRAKYWEGLMVLTGKMNKCAVAAETLAHL